jgi:hypothetical protein
MDFFREYASLFEWLGILSVVTFVGSLIAIPWIIARLPKDYFIRHRQLVASRHARHPLTARIIFVLRNTAGLLFLLAGLIMLVLPGQGIITVLIGISLMDFHHKHTVVDYLVQRPKVITLLNWIRRKEEKPPFEF